MRAKTKHGEAISEINIIPFVDVILVLLIIFMVAAPMLQQGIDIDLPEVNASAVESTKEDFVLSVRNDGTVYIGDDKKTAYTTQTLEEKLQAIFENKEKKELYIRADKDIRYGFMMEIMAICQKAGVERMGMITQPENNAKK
ncbi:MAG: protein TolR [Deltaproteobacteria bacterium RIFCSPLOWO2_12_FULL_40_28]|nr:MAG: protein TolR [Deltaproteobacteria bacterium RIFCSPHIGHO2_02_FULL_40_28]OGQ19068.1 MAG: protein TolR [Deltaproteobacteria bacterium RIFCSPHIGHO2_12_FULL_40_32]OGQ40240.1 MAG: protein TolR [Deltaproteobacteria bacterium RIFCSPLOWO2_02_FULL_40_36]OGQ53511.1 MAG: protein TolR [Deltaproteobacteria bacterium RIFCSPLOWO2_12_FULL_40_28]